MCLTTEHCFKKMPDVPERARWQELRFYELFSFILNFVACYVRRLNEISAPSIDTPRDYAFTPRPSICLARSSHTLS